MHLSVLDFFMQSLEGAGVVISDLSEASKSEEGEGAFLLDHELEDEEVDEEELAESEDVKVSTLSHLICAKWVACLC